ncbi:MAG: MFS transporter [bacterium]|nr:MFS transporter [bacterium]
MDTKTKNRAVAWLTTAHFTGDIFSGFLNPIMPFIALKLSFSIAIATLILSIAQICGSLIQPIFGFFADNIYKRTFIFIGILLATTCTPIAVNVPNKTLLTIFIVLGCIGGSLFHPQALGFIPKFSDKNLMHNMSLFITAGTLGFAFGPIVSALTVQHLGFEKVPYLALIGVILTFSMFKFVPRLEETNQTRTKYQFKETFKEILTNKKMLILIAIGSMKTIIISSCTIFLPFLWRDMGKSPAYIGKLLFLFILAGSLASYLSTFAEKKFGARPVFIASMTLTFPLMIIYTLIYKTHPTIANSLFILMGFITMFAQPVTMVMAQKVLPKYKSIAAGFINGFTWGIVSILLTTISFTIINIGIPKILLILSFLPVIFAYFVKFLPNKIEEA